MPDDSYILAKEDTTSDSGTMDGGRDTSSGFKDVVKDFGGDPQMVHDIVLNHMRIHQINDMRPFKQDKFRSIACFDKLDKFSQADFGGFKK